MSCSELSILEKDTLQREIGKLLADGYDETEILETLRENNINTEGAIAALREIYTGWRQITGELDLDIGDRLNWHARQRKQLLREAIEEKNTPSRRLVLSILDSLADLQGLSDVGEQKEIPVAIIFEPKPEVEDGTTRKEG